MAEENSLEELLPKSATCTIKLKGGAEVQITFRPFLLRDLAWIKHEFGNTAAAHAIATYDPDAICKLMWNLLEPESKAQFANISFEDFDEETGQIVRVAVQGHKRLLHAFNSYDDMLKAFEAYCNSEGMGNFIALPQDKKKVT